MQNRWFLGSGVKFFPGTQGDLEWHIFEKPKVLTENLTLEFLSVESIIHLQSASI